MCPKLLFPATVAARGLDALAPALIANLQVQPVFYQIVSSASDLPLDALAIRNAYGSLVLDVEEAEITDSDDLTIQA